MKNGDEKQVRAGSAAGFTLVELLVVIVILGVLAGVSAIGYRTYMKKAATAGDQQLLSAVNTAFAAACTENNLKLKTVSAAFIRVSGGRVMELSSVEVDGVADTLAAERLENAVAASFQRYCKGNEEAVFQEENVNSLEWQPAKGTFLISSSYTDVRGILSNGTVVKVPAQVMEQVHTSGYEELDVTAVTGLLKDANAGAATLALLTNGGAGTQLTQVFVNGGFMDRADAAALGTALESGDGAAAGIAANGLQMVTAAYIAGANARAVEELAEQELGSSTDLIASMETSAGAANCAALSTQYALAVGCSRSEFNVAAIQRTKLQNVGGFPPRYETVVVEEFASVGACLASDWAVKNPVEALALIQGCEGYANYRDSDLYQQDLNGFAGSMSAVGGNLTSIGYDNYLQNGIEDENAQAVLGVMLGK